VAPHEADIAYLRLHLGCYTPSISRRSALTGSGLALTHRLASTIVGEVQLRQDPFRGALDACVGGSDRGDRLFAATRPARDVLLLARRTALMSVANRSRRCWSSIWVCTWKPPAGADVRPRRRRRRASTHVPTAELHAVHRDLRWLRGSVPRASDSSVGSFQRSKEIDGVVAVEQRGHWRRFTYRARCARGQRQRSPWLACGGGRLSRTERFGERPSASAETLRPS
jgi:hypothetical protein